MKLDFNKISFCRSKFNIIDNRNCQLMHWTGEMKNAIIS